MNGRIPEHVKEQSPLSPLEILIEDRCTTDPPIGEFTTFRSVIGRTSFVLVLHVPPGLLGEVHWDTRNGTRKWHVDAAQGGVGVGLNMSWLAALQIVRVSHVVRSMIGSGRLQLVISVVV